ncbi:hypothetical protein EYZ11_010433 [Aspergillus tanneri]|uniref:Uncharacterized protein n=1 Tax=Aspergillus tanneri TaxID=1220188 RepID=A0A4S3JAR6_9EURO|nr:hypothetical protein EYZ11_010433 [Aspergillus tanneri]
MGIMKLKEYQRDRNANDHGPAQ